MVIRAGRRWDRIGARYDLARGRMLALAVGELRCTTNRHLTAAGWPTLIPQPVA
jgi:hypothetical protein